jgi:hypothetical protein
MNRTTNRSFVFVADHWADCDLFKSFPFLKTVYSKPSSLISTGRILADSADRQKVIIDAPVVICVVSRSDGNVSLANSWAVLFAQLSGFSGLDVILPSSGRFSSCLRRRLCRCIERGGEPPFHPAWEVGSNPALLPVRDFACH